MKDIPADDYKQLEIESYLTRLDKNFIYINPIGLGSKLHHNSIPNWVLIIQLKINV